jgi:hypothetical protein
MFRRGTRFVRFNRIAINLLCTQPSFVRLLQCADLVTSCVTAHVAGENVWSPRVFAALKPLLHSNDGRIGGYGLKLHNTRHRNLYHWLLGDSTYHAGGQIYPLPFTGTRDHLKPPELEGWRIYLKRLEIVTNRRPLILFWLELSKPGPFPTERSTYGFEANRLWHTRVCVDPRISDSYQSSNPLSRTTSCVPKPYVEREALATRV